MSEQAKFSETTAYLILAVSVLCYASCVILARVVYAEGGNALTVLISRMAIFFVNVVYSLIAGPKAPDNPWGEGATTLEWTQTSPPAFHTYSELPRIT